MSKTIEIGDFLDRFGRPLQRSSVVIFKGGTYAVMETKLEDAKWVLHPCGVNRESEDIIITHAVANNCEISI